MVGKRDTIHKTHQLAKKLISRKPGASPPGASACPVNTRGPRVWVVILDAAVSRSLGRSAPLHSSSRPPRHARTPEAIASQAPVQLFALYMLPQVHKPYQLATNHGRNCGATHETSSDCSYHASSPMDRLGHPRQKLMNSAANSGRVNELVSGAQ